MNNERKHWCCYEQWSGLEDQKIPFSKMSKARASRSLNEMKELVAEGKLTQTGCDWLTQAIDPFHDQQLPTLEGWPDAEVAPSLVRCVKKSFTISKPQSVTSGTWDAHIIAWPWQHKRRFWDIESRVMNSLGTPQGGRTVQYNIGGVQAFGTFTGTDLSPTTSPTLGQTFPDVDFHTGSTRLVAMGVEIENTTSQLNVQGIGFHWKMAQPGAGTQSNWHFVEGSLDTDSPAHNFTGEMYRCPPRNTDTAMLLPGTRSWVAKEGSYTVVPFVGPVNPPQTVSYIQPVLDLAVHDEAVFQESEDSAEFETHLLVPVQEEGILGGFTSPANKIFPIHMCGSIYAGLSLETTLTIRVNYYIETFPRPYEPRDLTLATPSAPYDPLALQLFAECMGNMAVATQLKNNPLGEYFAEAIKNVADFAEPLLEISGIPYAGLAARTASKLASMYMAPPNSNGPAKSEISAVRKAKRVARINTAKTRARAQPKVVVVKPRKRISPMAPKRKRVRKRPVGSN